MAQGDIGQHSPNWNKDISGRNNRISVRHLGLPPVLCLTKHVSRYTQSDVTHSVHPQFLNPGVAQDVHHQEENVSNAWRYLLVIGLLGHQCTSHCGLCGLWVLPVIASFSINCLFHATGALLDTGVSWKLNSSRNQSDYKTHWWVFKIRF